MTPNASAFTEPPAGSAPLALFAGGKSGGHVFPALAVAEVLRARGWRLAFVGNRDSMESRLAATAGLAFHPIASAAFVGQGIVARARAVVVVGRSVVQALRLLGRLRPSVVLGTGGFVAVPTILAAALRRLPIVLLEPNARAGAANRLLSRFASWAALAYSSSASDLRCASLVTGVPIRRAFFDTPEAMAEAEQNAERPPRVLVVGGSQGARTLNLALPGVVHEGLLEVRCTILHQTGAGRVEETAAAYRNALPTRTVTTGKDIALEIAGGPRIELVPFIDDMPAAVAASSVVVSRAGAVTLGELCAVGRASVLLPLPLAGAHQEQNAAELQRSGAARVVHGDDWSQLSRHLAELLSQPELRRAMHRAAADLARPNAASVIAGKMEELAA